MLESLCAVVRMIASQTGKCAHGKEIFWFLSATDCKLIVDDLRGMISLFDCLRYARASAHRKGHTTDANHPRRLQASLIILHAFITLQESEGILLRHADIRLHYRSRQVVVVADILLFLKVAFEESFGKCALSPFAAELISVL